MKQILLSTDDAVTDISRLEKTVASDFHSFHIRKPNWSRSQLEMYLKTLPKVWKDRSVLHSHFDLIHDFNLKGIHLNEKNRSEGAGKSFYPHIISTSFHSIDDLLGDHSNYEYVFLSPVFDSISKAGYRSAFSTEELRRVNKLSKHRIIALGGVRSELMGTCKDMGFSGVALLGAFWHKEL